MYLSKQLSGLCSECAAEAVLALEFAPSTELDCSVTWCPHHMMAAHFLADATKLRTFFLFPASSLDQAKMQAANLLDALGLAALARAGERHQQQAQRGGAADEVH